MDQIATGPGPRCGQSATHSRQPPHAWLASWVYPGAANQGGQTADDSVHGLQLARHQLAQTHCGASCRLSCFVDGRGAFHKSNYRKKADYSLECGEAIKAAGVRGERIDNDEIIC